MSATSAAVSPSVTTSASSLNTSRKIGVKRDDDFIVIHFELPPYSSLTTGVMNVSRG